MGTIGPLRVCLIAMWLGLLPLPDEDAMAAAVVRDQRLPLSFTNVKVPKLDVLLTMGPQYKITLHLARFVAFFTAAYGHERLSSCLRRDVVTWQTALTGQGLMGVAKDKYPRDGTTLSFVAAFAEIEADVETGVYRILDYLCVADVGTVIHPASLGGPWGVVAATLAVAMSAAIMLGTDRAGLPRAIAIVGGVCVGVLTVVALPSIPTPRFREPWGLVCNEAMHQGRPVIASDSVGAAAGGLVRDGETGIVVRSGDPTRAPAISARARQD